MLRYLATLLIMVIAEAVIAGASALVLTSYLVRCKPGEPMPDATMKAIEIGRASCRERV